LTDLELERGIVLRVPRVDLPTGTPVRVRVPARDIALALSQPADVSTVNRLPGTVISLQPLDATYVDVQVRISEGTLLRARVTHEATERLALTVGMPVWCLVKSVALDRATLLMLP
jgi:molybdate transport system ATP-binding protein